MRQVKGLPMKLQCWPIYTLRLRGLSTILAGQLERNHRARSYGYEHGDFVQSDLTRARPQFRTLVQHAG